MDDLYIYVQRRISRINQLYSGFSLLNFTALKEEEYYRSEKQNSLVLTMKLNRNITADAKLSFYHRSLSLMKQLNSGFIDSQIKNQEIIQEFLDRFVGLYKSFFKLYEQSLQFKTKLDSYIRPTNHNVIVDIVKYFVQFTRDYYQQMFTWRNKSSSEKKNRQNTEKIQKLQSFRKQRLSEYRVRERQIQKEKDRVKEDMVFGNFPRNKTRKQTKATNHLDIIDANVCFFFSVDCHTNNPYLKVKINQMFKDSKIRNTSIKQIINGFQVKHTSIQQSKTSEKQQKKHRKRQLAFPIQIILMVDKTGNICLNLQQNFLKVKSMKQIILGQGSKEVKRSSETVLKQKQKQFFLKPLNAGDPSKLTINNLKILRISDNFLPPIFLSKKPRQNLDKTKDFQGVRRQSEISKSISQTARKLQSSMQTQQRLIQWLNKIKLSKQQERKRLFGLQIK